MKAKFSLCLSSSVLFCFLCVFTGWVFGETSSGETPKVCGLTCGEVGGEIEVNGSVVPEYSGGCFGIGGFLHGSKNTFFGRQFALHTSFTEAKVAPALLEIPKTSQEMEVQAKLLVPSRCGPLDSPTGDPVSQPTTDFDEELKEVLNLYRNTISKHLYGARGEYSLLFVGSAEGGICRSTFPCFDPSALLRVGKSATGPNGRNLQSRLLAYHGDDVMQVPVDLEKNIVLENSTSVAGMADVTMSRKELLTLGLEPYRVNSSMFSLQRSIQDNFTGARINMTFAASGDLLQTENGSMMLDDGSPPRQTNFFDIGIQQWLCGHGGQFVRDKTYCKGTSIRRLKAQKNETIAGRPTERKDIYAESFGIIRTIPSFDEPRIYETDTVFRDLENSKKFGEFLTTTAFSKNTVLSPYQTGLNVRLNHPDFIKAAKLLKRKVVIEPASGPGNTTASQFTLNNIAFAQFRSIKKKVEDLSRGWDDQFGGLEAPSPPVSSRDIVIAVVLVLPELVALSMFCIGVKKGFWMRSGRGPLPTVGRVLVLFILLATIGIALVPIWQIHVEEYRNDNWKASIKVSSLAVVPPCEPLVGNSLIGLADRGTLVSSYHGAIVATRNGYSTGRTLAVASFITVIAVIVSTAMLFVFAVRSKMSK